MKAQFLQDAQDKIPADVKSTANPFCVTPSQVFPTAVTGAISESAHARPFDVLRGTVGHSHSARNPFSV
ncbi:hypothetical protein AXG93_3137s1220 [Marchantia polymorpha subsp. ruderalis]|uniref:Uncharacterized protein n=1 Tax=Marchantia polymorpha subsp. ruderalis TaxID=1480154 RepID=A0A176W580_MARPO|nr:hypothetical protein AXG93_3137s1220 [Marchantia polymorpha subsp. ruderalis]